MSILPSNCEIVLPVYSPIFSHLEVLWERHRD